MLNRFYISSWEFGIVEKLWRKRMKKLILELYRVESLVFGRVVHMDESLRGGGTLAENSEFQIPSSVNSSLYGNVLYINGVRKGDDGILFSYHYESTNEAKKIVENISELVAEINNKEDIKKKESLFIEKIL